MSTTRRPEDVTADEIERAYDALHRLPNVCGNGLYVGVSKNDIRHHIASGLLVPPPRERTQMEKDEEEWCGMRCREGTFSKQDAVNMSFILSRLFPAAKAAGVTY